MYVCTDDNTVDGAFSFVKTAGVKKSNTLGWQTGPSIPLFHRLNFIDRWILAMGFVSQIHEYDDEMLHSNALISSSMNIAWIWLWHYPKLDMHG